mmetsp:Transcript_19543/g.23954  ORF Transcript_19543/g.23954 Transcript_19543/m.23954 type:complete len:401 (-) Transcript_19543:111-1313(-)
MSDNESNDVSIPSASQDKGPTSTAKRTNVNPKGTISSSVKKKVTRVRRVRKIKSGNNALIKYGSLGLLVAQMVGLVLLMRYTRTRHGANESSTSNDKSGEQMNELYISSTAVFLMECTKFIICLIVVFIQSDSSALRLLDELHEHIWMSPYEVLKLCVPSFLYTVQNNLLYLALTNLDAATYQVCYQLKILTTAIFSAFILGRRFSLLKWTSLMVLTVGVVIVENSGKEDSESDNSGQNRFLGLTAVLCAACTSGFSGVYFEKILKGSKTSLWIRNIQMGLPSIIISFLTVYAHDAQEVASKGFFSGYNSSVWMVIFVQAVGGLIVAIVVKYADNVLKVFASSFSIIISCFVSTIFFDFHPNLYFCLGASLVILSTVMYSWPSPKRRRPILPTSTKGPLK